MADALAEYIRVGCRDQGYVHLDIAGQTFVAQTPQAHGDLLCEVLELRTERDHLRRENQALRARVKAQAGDVRAKDKALARSRSAHDATRMILSWERNRISQLERQVLDAAGELYSLTRQLEIEREAHAQTVAQLQETEARLTEDSQDAIDAFETECERLSDVVNQQHATAARLAAQNKALVAALDAVQEQLLKAAEAAGKVTEEAGAF